MKNYIKDQINKRFPNVEFFNEPKLKDGYYHFTVIMSDWSTMNFRNSIFEVVAIDNRNNNYVELKVESNYLNSII